ncbi:flagellar hook-basal body complex protein FliE [Novosphingobium sp.]|uniref:flagellar hook-basal body complex protein FliE n=1 Tax=Novosphingobium sp. TaxID=1874826 RepID=UPI0035B1DFF7
MAIIPIGAIAGGTPALSGSAMVPSRITPQTTGGSFTDLLTNGLAAVDVKVNRADALMNAYALGEAVPVHQVTIAMEEARIAVELAVQVRERLTESYRSFMNMQL